MAAVKIIGDPSIVYPVGLGNTGRMGKLPTSGFTAPYTVQWTSANIYASALPATLGPFVDVLPARYTVTITDADGTVVSRDIEVLQLLQQAIMNGTLTGMSALSVSGRWCASGHTNFTNSQGGVAVFYNTGTTTFPQFVMTQILQADTPTNGAQFGSSICISGDTMVIGAQSASKVYVFIRSGSTWVLQAVLIASDASAGDQFGNQVALVGDYCVVSAGSWDRKTPSAITDSGALYTFSRSGTTWTQISILTWDAPTAGNKLGADSLSLHMSGSSGTLVASTNNALAAIVFVTADGGATWTQQQTLVNDPVVAGNSFGTGVHVLGDELVVSANNEDSAKGALYYFTRAAGVWTQQARLQHPSPLPSDMLQKGQVVAPGVIAAIGYGTDCNQTGIMFQAATTIYTFAQVGGVWSTGAKPAIGASPVQASNMQFLANDGTVAVAAGGSVYPISWCVQTPALTIIPGTVTNIPVFGNAVGAIGKTQVVGGTPPYTFTFTSGATPITAQNGDAKFGLTAGSYVVTVTDTAAATATYTYVITQPDAATAPAGSGSSGSGSSGSPPLAFSVKVFDNVPLTRISGGIITPATVTGGVPPYDVQWSGPNDYVFTGIGAQQNLHVGKYTGVVTDSAQAQVTKVLYLVRER